MSRREEINDNTYKKGTVKCYTVPKNNESNQGKNLEWFKAIL